MGFLGYINGSLVEKLSGVKFLWFKASLTSKFHKVFWYKSFGRERKVLGVNIFRYKSLLVQKPFGIETVWFKRFWCARILSQKSSGVKCFW